MMNLQHLTERLRNNQETSLRVVLTPRLLSKDTLSELLAAVQANESVRQVELLSCGSFLEDATPALWQSILGSFLGLPNLESFTMRGVSTASSFNDEYCAIPMEAFACIASTSLQVFSLSQLTLIGGPSRDLQCALQSQASLQEFQLICVGFLDDGEEDEENKGTAMTTSVLEPLLQTLSSLPVLENLEISGTFTPLGVLDDVPTGSPSLFRSKSLKRLSISDFIFPEAAMKSIIADLSTNSVLKELAISGNLTSSLATKLGHGWKHNKTLEAIALRVDNLEDDEFNQEIASAIGGSHLKVVSLCSFFGGPLTKTGRNAFARMMATNCTLEYVYVPCPYTDAVFWNNVRLYCGLNSAGRKSITTTTTKKNTTTKYDEEEEKKEDDYHSMEWSTSEISRSFLMAATKNATDSLSSSTTTPSSCKSSVSISLATSPGKRHQKLVEEARSTKRRKFPVVPTLGLSSMFIR